MKKRFFFIAIITLFCSCSSSYYYVVRHAERLNNSNNTPLSGAGFRRADDLREKLLSKKIDLIYVSTYLRTQQTAQPTATAKVLPFIIYAPDTTAGLVARLKKIKGKNVLVIGHSNTVPDIVQGLSGKAVPAIPEDDFDNFYIVRISNFGTTRVWLQTYGKPSP